MMADCFCSQCRRRFSKERGEVNRARKTKSGNVFCSRKCSGLARRAPKLPLAERKAKKAAYDVLYRAEHVEERRAAKREYYQLTRDPEKERAKRKARAAYHVAYCRKYYSDPKRKAHKVRYDQRRRDMRWGEWAECARLVIKLERLIRSKQPSWYERAKARGYYTWEHSTQKRKRDAQSSRW